MLVLSSSTQTLQAVLAGAKTSLDCPVAVFYTDEPATSQGVAVAVNGNQPSTTNGVTAVTICNAPGAGPGYRRREPVRRGDEHRERLHAAEDRDRLRDGEHRGRRGRHRPRQGGVVDDRLRQGLQVGEHRALPDLLDHLVGQPDRLALEGGHRVAPPPLVDELLQPLRKVGRRQILPERERRLGEEQPPRVDALGCRHQTAIEGAN